MVASRISATREVFSSTTPIEISEPDCISPNIIKDSMMIAKKYVGPSNPAPGLAIYTCGVAAASAAENSTGSPPSAVSCAETT